MKFRPMNQPRKEAEVERRGAVARLDWHRSVSPPRSSIRTCGFPASGLAHRKVKSIFPVSPHLLLLANKRSSDHLRATSAYAPTDDIRWPMSIIVLIASALLSTSDVADTPGERLSLTQAVSKLIPGDRDEILSHESGLRRNNDSSTLPSGYNYCAEGLGIRVYTQAGPKADFGLNQIICLNRTQFRPRVA